MWRVSTNAIPGSQSDCIYLLTWAGIATLYRLEGPGIEPGGGEKFRNRRDRHWGAHSLLYNGHRVSFRGVQRPGSGVDHPPPSSAEVKERVVIPLPPLGLYGQLQR